MSEDVSNEASSFILRLQILYIYNYYFPLKNHSIIIAFQNIEALIFQTVKEDKGKA